MEKESLQSWLTTIRFSHFITVEPLANQPYKQDEIVQRFRKVEFVLNKKYLHWNFPKLKPFEKFWLVGFKEGSDVYRNIHYHLLLYSPSKLYRRTNFRNIGSDIQMNWLMFPSNNITTGKRRRVVPLHIEKLSDSRGATIYSSKELTKRNDNLFFTSPKQ